MPRQPSVRNRCSPGCLKPSPRGTGKRATEIVMVFVSEHNQYTRKLTSPGTRNHEHPDPRYWSCALNLAV